MNCLMVTGTEASEAKFQATNICKVIKSEIKTHKDYTPMDMLHKAFKKDQLANELDTCDFDNIDREEVTVLIEDYFSPENELITVK